MEDHHHWFPCFDAPQHMVTTEVVATVPAPYRAISNGRPVESPVESNAPAEPAGWRRFHWRMERPHALYLLTRFCPDDTGLQGVVAEVARQVLGEAPPPLGNVSGVLQGLRALPDQHVLRLALRSEVEAFRAHAHRHLRTMALDVLNGACKA